MYQIKKKVNNKTLDQKLINKINLMPERDSPFYLLDIKRLKQDLNTFKNAFKNNVPKQPNKPCKKKELIH